MSFGSAGQPKRGYRRINWIERAIEPLRDNLDDSGFERLVSALAMVIGWEAHPRVCRRCVTVPAVGGGRWCG